MKNLKLNEKFKLLNNKTKLKALILPFLAIVVLITTIYYSYAYFYANFVCVGDNCNSSVEIQAGYFKVTYDQTNTISLATAEPMYDKYRHYTTNDSYIEFRVENNYDATATIAGSGDTHSACYSAYFDISELFDNLPVEQRFLLKYARWELYDADDNVIISAGTFTGKYAGDSVFLTGWNTLAYGASSHTFKLYIWLSYDPNENHSNQTPLLGGTITGSVRIDSRALTDAYNSCPVIVDVNRLPGTNEITITESHNEVTTGTSVTVKYKTEDEEIHDVINMCEITPSLINEGTSENPEYYGNIDFGNVSIGRSCTLITGDDEYPFEVWAKDLYYNNSYTQFNCESSQCALDTIANMLN